MSGSIRHAVAAPVIPKKVDADDAVDTDADAGSK